MSRSESTANRTKREGSILTPTQIDTFFRDGFLIIEKPQITDLEIKWCRELLLNMVGSGVGSKEGRNFDLSARAGGSEGISPQLFRPSLYSPELGNWAFRDVALDIARQLLGPEASLAADNTIYKPPRIGGPTPWHQDEAYNDPRLYHEQVTIWIAMFDTTVENGAMGFIPGSHRRGILPHRLHGGSTEANSIECCEGFEADDAKICPIKAGAMTIHHGRTVHGASGNKSDFPRLGYIFNYKNPPKRRTELGDFAWNANVAKSIHRRRKIWLLNGGFLVELVRFMRSNRDNRQYSIAQVIGALKRRLLSRNPSATPGDRSVDPRHPRG